MSDNPFRKCRKYLPAITQKSLHVYMWKFVSFVFSLGTQEFYNGASAQGHFTKKKKLGPIYGIKWYFWVFRAISAKKKKKKIVYVMCKITETICHWRSRIFFCYIHICKVPYFQHFSSYFFFQFSNQFSRNPEKCGNRLGRWERAINVFSVHYKMKVDDASFYDFACL